MSKIMLPNSFTDDERWLSTGSDAFALFISSLCWSDRSLTDGRILKAVAPRLCLTVSPDDAATAIRALLDAGLWVEDEENYWVPDYTEYGLPKAEQERVRARWRDDKRRRRLHNVGTHDECAPGKCLGASGTESTPEAAEESQPLYPTRHDPTRHDPTLREGSVEGSLAPAPATSPSREDAGRRIEAHAYTSDATGLYCEVCNLPQAHAAHRLEEGS